MNYQHMTNLPNRILWMAFLPFLILFSNYEQAIGQSPLTSDLPSIFEQMMAVKQPKITLLTDLDSLVANKMKSDYQPAHFIFGKKIDQKIEIRPRGKFRRKICEFPPIKLKFSKKQLRALGLDTLNQMKLVTHCADSEDGDQLIAREFLVYKLYETITPIAFKSRLVEVNYQDSEDKKHHFTRLAILLEGDDELAARLGGSVVDDIYNLPLDSLNSNQAAINSLFQYMIGNTDWSVEGVRNIKFLRPKLGGKLVPVPYDFDFSGFVNASYASPNSEFPIKNIRDRYFVGKNLPEDSVRRAAKCFHKKEFELYKIINQSSYLMAADKEDLTTFLETFFAKLNEMNDLPVNKIKVADR